VRCYTSPWLVVQHRYREYSTGNLVKQSGSRINTLSNIPRQEFEIDGENDTLTSNDEDSISNELTVPSKVLLTRKKGLLFICQLVLIFLS